MDATKLYTLTTTAYLTTTALPLLATPRLIVTLCAAEPRSVTDLESYLCRALGLVLLTLAAQCLCLTGVIPLPAASSSKEEASTTASDSLAPARQAALLLTTLYHAIASFHIYTQITGTAWSFAFVAGLTLSAGLFCFGTWTLMFGGGEGRTSKTGNDKRTGNFPFENKESAKEKKREERREKERDGKEGKRRGMTRMKSRGD